MSDAKIAPAPDLAQLLTETERERQWPNVTPRDAATLIILDRSGKTPKILMGKRHAGHKFMPGKFVFPGGRVDPTDKRMAISGVLPQKIENKLLKRVTRGAASRPRALALAAIRETFEETGLVLGSRDFGPVENPPPGPWTDYAAHGVHPSFEGLHFIARAITPPRRPKRFDTAFFAIDADEIAHRVEGVISADTELVELVWLPLAEAQKLDLPAITSVVLRELEIRIAAGMGHDEPVPFFHERNRKWLREEL